VDAEPEPPLALLLLNASRWFDRRLLSELESRGWPRLSPAQSLVFAHLDPAGTSPAELARRLGTARQSTHELVAALQTAGLLALQDDPGRRRGRLVTLTPQGRALAADARAVLYDLERGLGPRAAVLREVLGDGALLEGDGS